ncbi:hypothetical protein OG320_19805 [Microbispora sp. NBC_01189]|uniref:hypothetical protein n=1 Tax=Microbispora sp. NBC_01189 TaxID=2903583 RepID=UPI002E139D8A|nr:hypothetical protein OG320_19805 [Microbispora sp. NBC_01189]
MPITDRHELHHPKTKVALVEQAGGHHSALAPIGRLLDAAEVAGAVVYLGSAAAQDAGRRADFRPGFVRRARRGDGHFAASPNLPGRACQRVRTAGKRL